MEPVNKAFFRQSDAIDRGDLSAVRQVVRAAAFSDAVSGVRRDAGRRRAGRVQRDLVRRRQEFGS